MLAKRFKPFVGGMVRETHLREARCSEMCESLIPHFNYSKINRGGCSLISFIHVHAKNAKPLKLVLEGGREKGRGTHVWEAKVR